MKRLFIILTIAVTALGLASFDAEARRLGGAKSFGKQQPAVTRDASPPAPPPGTAAGTQSAAPVAGAAAPNTAGTAGTAAAASGKSRWLGPLAGVAAGLGIAALLGHFGLGAELAGLIGNLLLIALLAFAMMFVWRMLRGRAAPARPQPAYVQRGLSSEAINALGRESMVNPHPSAPLRLESASQPGAGRRPAVPAPSLGIPAGFDVETFTRNAKVYFVRLQAAWDAGNLNDIREFTTPEMFAEIRMQLEERGTVPNQTDVVTLDAEVLGVASTASEHMASVRFHGMLREQEGGAAQPFDEVWNLTKPAQGGGGWVLAGIQQIQTEPAHGIDA